MDLAAPWLLVLALAWTSFAALRRHARLRVDEALLGAGLLAAFEILAVSTVLGLLGVFTRRPAIFFTGVIAAGQGLSTALVTPLRERRADAVRPWAWPLWPAAAFVAAAIAARLALAAALPVDSWDGLTYHMPILWRWVAQGNFDLAGWDGPQRWFPWNGELLPAWLAVIGGGSLGPAKLAQTLALPILAAAGASLGRRLAGRAWSSAAALAFAAIPIAVIHAGIPYVDGFQAAFWLGAAAFAVAWDKSGRRSHLLLFSLGFGLTLGTKSTIYFLAPLGLPILATLIGRPDRRRPFLRALPWCALIAFAAGGYTYARNWATMGNPIYPYALTLAGVKIFNGPAEPGQLLVTVETWFVSSRWGWLTYPFHETMKNDLGYTTENGFGPLFAAGWLLLPWSAFLSWRRRDRAALSFLALVPATAFFFFTLHPTREPRYVVFLAGVPLAGLALALRGLRGRARLFALSLWGLGAAWGALGVLDFIARDPGLARAWGELTATGRVDAHAYYRSQYGSLGEAWEFLDARLAPGDVVAVNYGELLLPWAGVPPRAKLYVIGHKPSDFPETLWGATSDEWLAQLNEVGANYLAVWAPAWYPDVGADELATIAAHPEKFASLGVWSSPGMGRVELFELKR